MIYIGHIRVGTQPGGIQFRCLASNVWAIRLPVVFVWIQPSSFADRPEGNRRMIPVAADHPLQLLRVFGAAVEGSVFISNQHSPGCRRLRVIPVSVGGDWYGRRFTGFSTTSPGSVAGHPAALLPTPVILVIVWCQCQGLFIKKNPSFPSNRSVRMPKRSRTISTTWFLFSDYGHHPVPNGADRGSSGWDFLLRSAAGRCPGH